MGLHILEGWREKSREDWQADKDKDNEMSCTHREELDTITVEQDALFRRTNYYLCVNSVIPL